MDSVTQAVLGASVGHAIAGRKAGRAAMVAGAIGGTIPDLDILFAPFLDSVSQLGVHRGFSHSFTFAILAAPLFGIVFQRLVRRPVSRATWTVVGLGSLLTHILLDSLTVYGTGLLEPFSNARPAIPLVFIIDPLYTVPLIVGLVGAVAFRSRPDRAVRWTQVGLVVSSLYLVWAGLAKMTADRAFDERFAGLGLEDVEFTSMPTPLNTILWRALAKVDEGTLETYYSILADEEASDPQLIPRRDSLLASVRGSRAADAAIWFSKGYFTVTSDVGMPKLHDFRFGRANLDGGPFRLTLSFVPDPQSGELGLEQQWGREIDPGATFDEIWGRAIHGERK